MSAEALSQFLTSQPDRRSLMPPAWTQVMLGPTLIRHGWRTGSTEAEVIRGSDHALVSVRVPRARAMSSAILRTSTADAYAQIAKALRDLCEHEGPAHPVRFWNFIPGVLDDMGARENGVAQNRYMAFNAGRFAAFTTWYGDIDAFDHRVATATGVGHEGDDLVIHCMSARGAGVAIANPRQTPPHRYSRRYGPLPPCFARATLLRATGQLLVGGTASVVGEDSLHVGDLEKQFAETMINLAALADEATAHCIPLSTGCHVDALSRYRALRAYYPRASDQPRLADLMQATFSTDCEIEWVHADLCREDLLIEIEGLAQM